MPRYFFHLSFGQRTEPDEEGVELANRTAARDEALAVVRDLANPEHRGTRRRWAGWFLEVADERSGFFRTPIGHPALQLVTSDRDALCGAEPDLRRVRAESTLPDEAHAETQRLVEQRAELHQRSAQLMKVNQQLRIEFSSLRLATEALLLRTRRLVSLARVTPLLAASVMTAAQSGTFPSPVCLI